ncbi:MAG: sensor histidine kinase [Defluviicoccus sp.]
MSGLTRSLRLRLLLGAAFSIAAALLIAGLILAELFARHVHDRFRVELGHHLDQLAAALDVDVAGEPMLTRPPSDPRFERPLSGLYWQIAAAGRSVLRSRSLWDQALELPAAVSSDGLIREHRMAGPGNWRLLVLERSLLLPDAPATLRVAVAEDESDLLAALRAFNRTLALSLAALAVVLIIAAVFQVTLGLRPLGWLRDELAEIRSGRKRRFARPMPTEVQPLIEDLNALLDHADEVVERARLQAGNLAHGLKTNLSVLANAAEKLAAPDDSARRTDSGPLILAQIAAMRRHLDHHMARARAAAAAGLPGALTDVGACVSALIRVMQKVHADRKLSIRSEIPGGLAFAGDRQDLEEMLGNLLDNACKWATGKIEVTASREGPMLIISVDDDGSGLAPEQWQAALAPGIRLDQTVAGSGLGLAVVGDLVRLYGGHMELAQSPLGGLRARIRLPAVVDDNAD